MRKTINILLVLATLALTFLLVRQDKRLKKNIEDNSVQSLQIKEVEKKTDEKGNEHTIISRNENVISSLKKANESVKRELDSTLTLLGIKEKQLEQYISYNIEIKDSLLKAKKINDSLHTYTSDKIDLRFYTDKGVPYFDYKYNADIQYAEYWKRNWVFGKKQHYIDFWIDDINSKTNNVKRIKIEPHRGKVRLDINASSFYIDRLNVGFDGGLNFGRLRLGSGYFYDTSKKDWHPVFTAKFNLLDL